MEVLTAVCNLCENRLQWTRREGLYAGILSHYATVHPRTPLTLSEYEPGGP